VLRSIIAALFFGAAASAVAAPTPRLALNDRGYFSMPGLDVMAFQDFYPEGH
jgi:endoglucanase